jgi:hypothetical protein
MKKLSIATNNLVDYIQQLRRNLRVIDMAETKEQQNKAYDVVNNEQGENHFYGAFQQSAQHLVMLMSNSEEEEPTTRRRLAPLSAVFDCPVNTIKCYGKDNVCVDRESNLEDCPEPAKDIEDDHVLNRLHLTLQNLASTNFDAKGYLRDAISE